MPEYIRRLALVLLVAGVFLQGLFGLLPVEKIHTPRPAHQPWGLEARTVRRFGPRMVALRVQMVIV